LELSRSSWLITSLSPGGGEKMSKHSVPGGDFAGLMKRFAQLQEKAKLRTGQSFRIIVVQEAGLDGFWIHRALQNEGIESHIVDAASIATSRQPAGGQRPTRSMVKRWFECCSPTSAANLGSVLWSRRPLPAKKTAATSAASAKR
jgi:transposase